MSNKTQHTKKLARYENYEIDTNGNIYSFHNSPDTKAGFTDWLNYIYSEVKKPNKLTAGDIIHKNFPKSIKV